VDKQGRIGLPQHLRAYAQIEKDVIVLGVSARVEIWSQEAWSHYYGQAESSFDGIAEHIVGLGI
jgi:MraZ protein